MAPALHQLSLMKDQDLVTEAAGGKAVGNEDGRPASHQVPEAAVDLVLRNRVKGGGWLGWITGYNVNDSAKGYAGNGKPIDAIQVYYYTPDSIRPYVEQYLAALPSDFTEESWQRISGDWRTGERINHFQRAQETPKSYILLCYNKPEALTLRSGILYSAMDLRLILRYVCGKTEFTENQLEAGDVTGDGEVGIEDLRKVLRYVCGKSQCCKL